MNSIEFSKDSINGNNYKIYVSKMNQKKQHIENVKNRFKFIGKEMHEHQEISMYTFGENRLKRIANQFIVVVFF